ncbi:MAG: DUF1223 domain-containing protein [Kofleriaceae bacterium]
MRALVLGVLGIAAGCSTTDRPPAAVRPAAPTAARADPATGAPPAAGAVVVELFTSQGCSSCPPADQLLTELAARPDVIALAFHVDYWNDLGWDDPWSAPAWTARQHAYARTLPGQRVYTPELVVNGAQDVVGSSRRKVLDLLAAAPRVPALAATARFSGAAVVVDAAVPAGAAGLVALVEDGLDTAIAAGENRGLQLRNDRVVRALVPLAATSTTVPLAPGWRRDRLDAVVLARGEDHALVGAARIAIAP